MRIREMSVVALLASSVGCAICDHSLDAAYPTYGGKWQRSDPCCGRVGSWFDPAGGPAGEAWIGDLETGEPSYAESLEGESVLPPPADAADSPQPSVIDRTQPAAPPPPADAGISQEAPGALPGIPDLRSPASDAPPSPESLLLPR